jgi:peptidoglycan/LPS O-acetylase OafA/YrhL
MQQLGVLFHTVAALLIIGLAMAYEPLKRLLSSRAGLWLGQMSFPVYLTHLVVICSVGSYTFTAAKPLLPHSLSIALTLSVVFGVTFIVSYPLAIFDKTWVGFLNKFITDLRREGNRAGAGLTSTLPHQEMNRVRLSRQVLQLNILS